MFRKNVTLHGFTMPTLVFAIGVALFGLGTFSTPALSQEKGGEDELGPYEVDPTWQIQPFQTREGYVLGSKGSIFVESPNRIFIANRGELKLPEKLPPPVPPTVYGLFYNGTFGSATERRTANARPVEMHNAIIVVDGNGKMIETWTQWDHLFEAACPSSNCGRGPHSVKISPYDPEHHVWVIDDERQQIFKFTNEGKKLLMTLGEPGIHGTDGKHFGRPTDIAWLPDGTFFITDGYTNTRVMKFDKDGKFLMQWGEPGNGPGQFHALHAIAIDKKRRIYIADRDNSRIQVFDENGKFLDMWPNIFQPYTMIITADQYLGVIDGQKNKVLKYDLNGKLLSVWGAQGYRPGEIWGVHGMSVDQAGNLYVAEAFGGRTQRFKPKPGADKRKLIGPPPPLMPKLTT